MPQICLLINLNDFSILLHSRFDGPITCCYKFARNRALILQKCNIHFLYYLLYFDYDYDGTAENARFVMT